MSNRRQVRERTMQALYAFEVGGGDAKDVIQSVLVPDIDDDTTRLFAEDLFLRTLDYRDTADELIRAHTENWEVSRIALIDRLVLRMAIVEIVLFQDIPPKVSINEAIDVAKKFSTSKSGKFVNGILDSIVLTLMKEGKLKKSGRGLIGMDSMDDRSQT